MLSPDRVDRTVVLDGVEVQFEFSPAAEVDVRITTGAVGHSNGEAVVTIYHPSTARPDSFPLDLPFFPGIPVSVWEPKDASSGKRSVTWMSVPDADAAETQILEQCAAEGWVAEGSPLRTPPLPPVRTLVLRHGARIRVVNTSQFGLISTIAFLDTREE
jgi:hypothetical protein